MAIPLIKINQGPTQGVAGESRSNLEVGTLVEAFDDANTTGTWSWVFVPPPDSSAVATGLTTSGIQFTPDTEGTYLLFTVHNGTEYSYSEDGIGQYVSTQGGAAIRLVNGRRIPGVGETQQFSDEDGWAATVTSMIKDDIRLYEEGIEISGGPFTSLDFRAIGGGSVDVSTTQSGIGVVTISGGAGGGGGSSPVDLDFIYATMSTDYTANVSVGLAVPYDTETSQRGNLSVDGSGRISGLSSGNTYRISYVARPSNNRFNFQLYNVTTSSFLGTEAVSSDISPSTLPGSYVFECTQDTEIEVRLTSFFSSADDISSTGSFFQVEQIGASSSSSLQILDEGSSLTSSASSIDFVGPTVISTNSGNDVTVTISGANLPVVWTTTSGCSNATFQVGSDGVFKLDYFLKPHTGSTPSVRASIMPNGSNQGFSFKRSGRNSTAGIGSTDYTSRMVLFDVSTCGYVNGSVILNMKTNSAKTYYANNFVLTTNNPPDTDATDIFPQEYAGVWDDNTDPVTLIRIETDDGSPGEVDQIGISSFFILTRLN